MKKKPLSRKEYFKRYRELGGAMFEHCTIPTVYDFADAFLNKNENAMDKIKSITDYTKNHDDIVNSVNRRHNLYSDQESEKFLNQVIAANVTDITDSGFFYKKLISSCDGMVIDANDCKSKGVEMELPIDEDTFNFRVRNHWVMELDKYVENYKDIPKKGTIHVRTFLDCKHGDTRHFCKKCAGLFRRSYDTSFTPRNIGAYATYMITEKATQASLDSMNKGTAKKPNVLIEESIPGKFNSIDDAKQIITSKVDGMRHDIESRFYEIAFISRFRFNGDKYTFVSLQHSSSKQEDVLGAYIAQPKNSQHFKKLLLSGSFEANSTRTSIAFDKYDGMEEENVDLED